MRLMATVVSKRNEMVEGWRRDFKDVRMVWCGHINLRALRDEGDKKETEIVVRGTAEELPRMFEEFDKKVRSFMKGHRYLVMRNPPATCGTDDEAAIFLTGWAHDDWHQDQPEGSPYYGG